MIMKPQMNMLRRIIKKQEFSDQDMRCTCVAWRIVNGKYDNILKELNTKDKK